MSITHTASKMWRKGIYAPTNPSKYKGSNAPVFRSQWEYRFMRFLDFNDSVLEWTSEEPLVPYHNPNTNTTWNYHPDFLIKIKTQTGVKIQMIEIKPKKQTMPPKTDGRRSTVIRETMLWNMNQAKWSAAKKFCDMRNWEFKILTEKELFG